MADTDQMLRAVVNAHSTFYDNLSARSPATKSWIARVWKPWEQRWEMIIGDGGELAADTIHVVAKSLSDLRINARRSGVPVPVLSPFAHPEDHLAAAVAPQISYPHPTGDIMAPGDPTPGAGGHWHYEAPAPRPTAAIPTDIDLETDRRFRTEMGWSPNRTIDIRREASLARRWLEIRYQVAQEFAAANG